MAEQELTWRRPPETGKGRRGGGFRYAKEAAAARGNPGEWLLIKEFPVEEEANARNMRSQIMGGRYHVFRPPGEWDVTSAKEENDNGATVVNVYICFTGKNPG